MVSNLSILFMVLSALVTLFFPVALFVYYRKEEKISFKPVFIGALIFVIFTQVLERALHMYVMSTPLYKMTVAFSIYAALAAGVFEECGRFFAFKVLLKKNREWRDGMAYGIGHGGIESILVGTISYVTLIVFSKLLNNGLLEKTIGSKMPAGAVEALKTTLTGPSIMFLAGSLERIFAITLHIGMTFIVLYGIQKGKNIYLLYAILAHALFDMLPGLYQMKVIPNVWVIEGILLVLAVIIVIGVGKTKHKFRNEPVNNLN